MITAIYAKYFQKSKTFIFPFLSIPKNAPYTPLGVYVSWKDVFTVDDKKVAVVFQHEDNPAYQDFIITYLYNNPLYLEERSTKTGEDIFIFSLENYAADYACFLEGKYSKYTAKSKKIIRNYFGETSSEYRYIDTYLYPERYFELYARLLGEETATLEEVGELCDKYNPVEEELKIIVEDLEVSKKAL